MAEIGANDDRLLGLAVVGAGAELCRGRNRRES
jgi:hypothetical protein